MLNPYGKRSVFCVLAAIGFFCGSMVASQQPKDAVPPPPVPAQIAAAKTVFIANAPGQNLPKTLGTPDRTYNEFYAAMKASGRYEMVPVPAPQSPTDTPGTRMRKVIFVPLRDAPVRIVQALEGTMDVTGVGRDPVTGLPYKPWTGKPFQAGDDWMKNLVFVVKNSSNKKVTAMNFTLIFPDTGAGTPSDPGIVAGMSVGRLPENALYNPRTGQKRTGVPEYNANFSLLPNQEFRFAVAPYYDEIKAAIETKQPISTITICQVGFEIYYFADGTRLDGGGDFAEPDPNRPGAWLRITRDEWNAITPVRN
jgi:hypothetical protein